MKPRKPARKIRLLHELSAAAVLLMACGSAVAPAAFASDSAGSTGASPAPQCEDKFGAKVPGILGQYLARFQPRLDLRDKLPRFGIEVEGVVAERVGHKGLAEALARVLKEKLPGVQIDYTPASADYYRHRIEYRLKGTVYRWSILGDSTIQAHPGMTGVEVVSPVLADAEDFALYRDCLRALQLGGMRAEPLSAGVHVHVEFDQPSAPELSALALVFSRLEAGLMEAYSMAPTRGGSARRTSPKLLRDLQGPLLFIQNFADFSEAEFKSGTGLVSAYRPHALNLSALLRHGTAEFRWMNSTMNARLIETKVNIVRNLVAALRSKAPQLLQLLASAGDAGLLPLDRVLPSIGIDGGELEWVRAETQAEIAASYYLRYGSYPDALADTALMDPLELQLIHRSLLPHDGIKRLRATWAVSMLEIPERPMLVEIIESLTHASAAINDRSIDLLVSRVVEKGFSGPGGRERYALARDLLHVFTQVEHWADSPRARGHLDRLWAAMAAP